MVSALVFALAASCPDPAVLDRQLDDALVRLRPGLSLEEVSAIAQTPREYLVPHDGQVFVLVNRGDRHRVAGVVLACQYAGERLGDCRLTSPREHTVLVHRADYDKLKLGQSIASVLAAFCQPAGIAVQPDGGVVLSYSTAYPFEAYLPYGSARLRFGSDGKLRQKVGPEK